jgi:hypothetical protein
MALLPLFRHLLLLLLLLKKKKKNYAMETHLDQTISPSRRYQLDLQQRFVMIFNVEEESQG